MSATFASGIEAHKKGDIRSAISYYEKAISEGFLSASLYSNLAVALILSGNKGRSLAAAKAAVCLGPSIDVVYNNIHNISKINGDHDLCVTIENRISRIIGGKYHRSRYKTDCSKCMSLCCVGLHLSPSRGFSFEKPPGIPCHYLDVEKYSCKIFRDLDNVGCSGCRTFECYGAGPIVADVMKRNGCDWRALGRDEMEGFLQDFQRLWRLHFIIFAASKFQNTEFQNIMSELHEVSISYERNGILASREEVGVIFLNHKIILEEILMLAGYNGG